MKLRMNLLGLFIVTAILLPACSTSAATPEPAMEKGGSGVMTEKEIPEIMLEYEDAEDLMEKEDSEDMEGLEVSDDMIEKDDSDTMIDKDDSGNMMDSEDSDAMKETGDSDDMTETEISGAMMEVPTWFSVNLTDVNSGENLRVADLKDKVVLVETMANWCSNCLRQQ